MSCTQVAKDLTLLCCQQKSEMIFSARLASQLSGTCCFSRVFNSSSKFVRWLLDEDYSEIQNFTSLVSTWRCAKECASGLLALRTGNTEQLKVGKLQFKELSSSGGIYLPLTSMVVVCEKPGDEDEVQAWVSKAGRLEAGIPIYVARDTVHLTEVLKDLHDGLKRLASNVNRFGACISWQCTHPQHSLCVETDTSTIQADDDETLMYMSVPKAGKYEDFADRMGDPL